jgi:hypothetical protein
VFVEEQKEIEKGKRKKCESDDARVWITWEEVKAKDGTRKPAGGRTVDGGSSGLGVKTPEVRGADEPVTNHGGTIHDNPTSVKSD